jgi:hypothetical protein
MTDDMMTLQTLLAKQPYADVLREMIGFAAQRLMKLEVEAKTGAAHGERSPDRLTQRNGYRDRVWETRAGTAARPGKRAASLAGSAALDALKQAPPRRRRLTYLSAPCLPGASPCAQVPGAGATRTASATSSPG